MSGGTTLRLESADPPPWLLRPPAVLAAGVARVLTRLPPARLRRVLEIASRGAGPANVAQALRARNAVVYVEPGLCRPALPATVRRGGAAVPTGRHLAPVVHRCGHRALRRTRLGGRGRRTRGRGRRARRRLPRHHVRTAPPVSAPESTAVHTRGLRRVYGDTVAVHGLDLTVAAGEKFGFLGPNGAGKSTTISMLSTLLSPSGGRAAVAEADVARRPDEVRRRIGVVFQEPTADRELTGWQNLHFHARLYGMPRREVRAQARSLLDLMGLADRGDAPVGTYSGGMQRRLRWPGP
ncbi:ATP-binding cassette domain-containing protein [Streptomyces thinghirensis]|nr:ATP-binding cassette domain-containing protein [Streptomyces thinghirensis]